MPKVKSTKNITSKFSIKTSTSLSTSNPSKNLSVVAIGRTKNGQHVYITNLGSYLEGFKYNGRPLRVGWAGYIEKKDHRFDFYVGIKEQGNIEPIFRVTNPAGDVYEKANPTSALRAAGWTTGKVSGPEFFMLNSSIIDRVNKSRCSWCHEDPKTQRDLDRYVLES
jgi:hypothetical protein